MHKKNEIINEQYERVWPELELDEDVKYIGSYESLESYGSKHAMQDKGSWYDVYIRSTLFEDFIFIKYGKMPYNYNRAGTIIEAAQGTRGKKYIHAIRLLEKTGRIKYLSRD